MKRSKKVLLSSLLLILILGLLFGNFYWIHELKKEQEKIKHAIIPSLSNDYYSAQIALTQNAKNYQDEMYEDDPEIQVIEWESFQNEVPLVLQNPEYPNGCEAASAVMLLNYYGIKITLQEFIENYLLQEMIFEKDGVRFGPNPASYYAGNPSDEKRGWGCFEPVIANAMQIILKKYNQENYMESYIMRGESKYPLYMYFEFQQKPMMIWTTIDYEEVKEVYEWFSYDKKYTYTYPKNSHAIVITGMDELYYYINDPLKETKNIPVLREKLEKSFDSMGRQIIGLDIYNINEFLE